MKKRTSSIKSFFSAGRTKEDPEKCVLPTIIFVNGNHSSYGDLRHRGFLIAFGWWDFSMKIGLFY